MRSAPDSIGGYLGALGAEEREALERLRRTIQSVAPGAEECISYRLPAFRFRGKMLVAFGARPNRCALYLMSSTVLEEFPEVVSAYDTSKGTIRFQPGAPLPATLVRKLVRARIAENADRGGCAPEEARGKSIGECSASGTPTHVAFLRAVNVAGHGVVKMVELEKAFVAAGCRGVRSVIQSGNILFEAPAKSSARTLVKIQREVDALLRKPVGIAFRTGPQIGEMLRSNPLGRGPKGAEEKLYVGFLMGSPKSVVAVPFRLEREGFELLGVTGSEAFVVSRPVKGRYGFPNPWLEKLLGVGVTTRNWNTVSKIAALMG